MQVTMRHILYVCGNLSACVVVVVRVYCLLLSCRVLPLLKCYSHEQRVTALEHLLVYWVAGPTAAASASQPQRGSSGSGAGGSNSSSNGSNGIMLAAALLAGEAELLQFAAAGSSLLAGEGTTTSSNQQQQQLLTQAAAAAGGSGLGPMLWDGDVAAMVSAVLAAVSACQATNQWARVEQLLDAAGAGLLAAAAVHGVTLQQHERQTAKDAGRVSSSSDDSYGSAAESSGGDESAIEGQPQEQQQLRQQGKEGRGGAASGEHATAGGDGWGDGWGSEEAEQEHDWHDASGKRPQSLTVTWALVRRGTVNPCVYSHSCTVQVLLLSWLRFFGWHVKQLQQQQVLKRHVVLGDREACRTSPA
jgi:hypothetical protein